MNKIQTGFLVSYDYEFLKKSLPPVYEDSDTIFLAIDHLRRTWKGNTYEIEPAFFDWIKEIDVDNKIVIYEDDFYVSDLNAIQNDTRERHMLGMKMGIGNWMIQVDSDEIFIDFKSFVQQLRRYDNFLKTPEKNPIQFAAFHINVYKYLEKGILYIDNPTKFYIATNYPNYKYAKNTRERIVYLDSYVLHEGLARTEEELRFKLKNWGHQHEINDSFLEKWLKVDETNYTEMEDFFYLDPKTWKKLGYFASLNLVDLRKLILDNEKLKKTNFWLVKKNFGQWFKHLFK
ncbi:hypothetical protein [Flavobacterium sp. I3-2]|uniref:hypothetical protein n=1 Tax=Flavobacterium sp. I3-2 TaxID=2748319 RepID=UPI0015AB3190|nr:hypothetical protein [Flavobacterium sp. I3-2]